MDIAGSCHCGNISFSLTWPDEAEIPARSCGCAFCVKHGGVWTSNPRATLRARITEAGMVARYAFGTETAQFLLCARCGVAPLVTSRIGETTYAVVNVNTFDDFDRVIGLCHLEAFHLNDSKRPLGARVDRHAIIGDGLIGLAPFAPLVRDSRFARVPGYLETPPLPDGEESYALGLTRLRSLL